MESRSIKPSLKIFWINQIFFILLTIFITYLVKHPFSIAAYILVLPSYYVGNYRILFKLDSNNLLLINSLVNTQLKTINLEEIEHIYIKQSTLSRIINSCELIICLKDQEYPYYNTKKFLNELMAQRYRFANYFGEYLVSISGLDKNETESFVSVMKKINSKVPDYEYLYNKRPIIGLPSTR